MPFLSELLGRPVVDAAGQRLGKLADLIVPAAVDYPVVKALVVADGRQRRLLPWEVVHQVEPQAVRLAAAEPDLPAYQPSEHDVYLASQVLDRQIIDINGTQVVRVNDLHLARTNGHYRLLSVDVSLAGLLRRLGLERPVARLLSVFGKELPRRVIAWQDVDPIESGPSGVRLRVPREDLARLHPADLAEIVGQLDQYHSDQVLAQLDAEQAAETVEEVAPQRRATLIEHMDDERAAAVLAEMAPDAAADLLADLDPLRAQAILERLSPEAAAAVHELLGYPEDSAGGLMTTEYIAVPSHLTAEETIALLREQAREIDNVYSVYVVDPEERLLGALTLRDLIIAPPTAYIREVMRRDVPRVRLTDSRAEVARAIAKYNLLAVPVVDAQDRLQGIVTVDAVLDELLPAGWKQRVPRLFR